MTTIVTRLGKGLPLTYAEMDANLTNLNNDKAEVSVVTTHTSATSAHGTTGAVVGTTDNQSLSNKTIALGSNTVSGTKAQFDAACTDGDFAYQTDIVSTKAYADSLVVGLLDDRGNYDASTNLFPSSGGSGTAGTIMKGDLWYISVAGTLGGVPIAVGDAVRALIDAPGQIAANWSIMAAANLGSIIHSVANKTTPADTDEFALADSANSFLLTKLTWANLKAYVSGLLGYFVVNRSIAAPNATIPAHSIEAAGVEGSIDFALVPKGNGALLVQVPDGTSTSGNKRGTSSTDLQKSRLVATQVASGDFSIVSHGKNNTSSGIYSISGGDTNIASGISSVALGANNTASGDYSTIEGGNSATTRGLYGRKSYASGKLSVVGDAQLGSHPLRLATTDATVSILTADGSATPSVTNVSVLPANTAYTVVAHITARNTSTGDMASWKIEGAVKQGANAAATALVGTPAITTIAKDAGASTWVVAMVANTTRGSVEIQVTGVAATNIHWMCKLDTIEVG